MELTLTKTLNPRTLTLSPNRHYMYPIVKYFVQYFQSFDQFQFLVIYALQSRDMWSSVEIICDNRYVIALFAMFTYFCSRWTAKDALA